MRTFTDEDLANLISCRKEVTEPPRREMLLVGAHKRNDLKLKSLDGKEEFSVFIRQSEDFPENFSVGLLYNGKEEPGTFQLLRCNGQHGGERVHPHHAVFHTHRISADDVNQGVREPRVIEETTAYASLLEALAHFCRTVGIVDVDQHFPGLLQGLLRFDSERLRRIELDDL